MMVMSVMMGVAAMLPGDFSGRMLLMVVLVRIVV